MKINTQSTVELHIQIRLKDGSIAETTQSIGKPLRFKMSTGVFSPKFEEALIGMTIGDKKKVMLLPEEAFGQSLQELIYPLPRSRFQHLEEDLEVGTVMALQDAAGNQHAGIIRAVDNELVTVDLNHPLAGQVVLFETEIVSIEN